MYSQILALAQTIGTLDALPASALQAHAPSRAHPPEREQVLGRYFGYELRDVDAGVAPASGRGAVLEDLEYGDAMYWRAPMRRSPRCGTRSPCRLLVRAPGRRSCRGPGSSCPPRRRSGSRRRCRSRHDHHARRFIAAIGAFLRTS